LLLSWLFQDKKQQMRNLVNFRQFNLKSRLKQHQKVKLQLQIIWGGQYFLTVDEVEIKNDNLYLIESKHSRNSILPSRSDIKDGLLKMILYSNLTKVEINGIAYISQAVLKLTSPKIIGQISSVSSNEELNNFISQNRISSASKQFIINLLDESRTNDFTVKIQNSL
jgi:hypothetical protein